MKTCALTKAQITSFFRNWKSVVLLIVFPLLLISTIFLSFNPNGLQQIPIGVVDPSSSFDFQDYAQSYFPYLDITSFPTIDQCMNAIHHYKQYVCIEVVGATQITVHYDNTRDPIIWEILERLKMGFHIIKLQKSKEIADSLLSQSSHTHDKVAEFEQGLGDTTQMLDHYITESEDSKQNLIQAKSDLRVTLHEMDQDIASVKQKRNNFVTYKNMYFNNIRWELNRITNIPYYASSGEVFYNTAGNVEQRVNELEDETNQYVVDVDTKIAEYEQKSRRGHQQLAQLDTGIRRLSQTQSDLRTYKDEVKHITQEVQNVQGFFTQLGGMTAEQIVDPIQIQNVPTYVPVFDSEGFEQLSKEEQAREISRGVNLISLQTMFPMMLTLVTLFLSLLISSFMCVNDINCPAKKRVHLVRNVFMAEFFSVYIASLFIVSIALFCIILLGQFLFQLPLFQCMYMYILMFLTSSIFILIGITVAYIVKKESTTILVSTFLLVFLMFLSGFIFPIEKMSTAPYYISMLFPGNVAETAFNQMIFYGNNQILISVALLVLWYLALMFTALIIKEVRRV